MVIEQERLPFKEGWRTPKTQISGFSLASDVLQLALATPEKTVDFGDEFNGHKPGKRSDEGHGRRGFAAHGPSSFFL